MTLWGGAAKEPFKLVYRHVDLIIMDSNRYWPVAIRRARIYDARGPEHTTDSPNFPQPTTMMYGHAGDEFGGAMERALDEAVVWYERRAGIKRRRKS